MYDFARFVILFFRQVSWRPIQLDGDAKTSDQACAEFPGCIVLDRLNSDCISDGRTSHSRALGTAQRRTVGESLADRQTQLYEK